MGWIRTEHAFDNRTRILTVSRRDQFAFTQVLNFLKDRELGPELLELNVMALIQEVRPELANGALQYMNYDITLGEWQFSFCHASFPPVAWGIFAPKETLMKENPLDQEPDVTKETDLPAFKETAAPCGTGSEQN